MGEPEDKRRPRKGFDVPRRGPPPHPPDTLSHEMNIDGVAVKVGKPTLPTVARHVGRTFAYLVGKSPTGYVLLRCSAEGVLLTEAVRGCPDRFGDSETIDAVAQGYDWQEHGFKNTYNHLSVYAYGGVVQVETSLDGNKWDGRGVTKGDGTSAPKISTMEMYVDFRCVRLRLLVQSKQSSYSIVAQKVICSS